MGRACRGNTSSIVVRDDHSPHCHEAGTGRTVGPAGTAQRRPHVVVGAAEQLAPHGLAIMPAVHCAAPADHPRAGAVGASASGTCTASATVLRRRRSTPCGGA